MTMQGSELVRTGVLQPYRTAADIIDWSLPCPSIFETSAEIKAKYGIRANRPLKPNTMARIAKGVMRYVVNHPNPFVVPITHSGDVQGAPDRRAAADHHHGQPGRACAGDAVHRPGRPNIRAIDRHGVFTRSRLH
jgi:hypothetical protein